jgi:hypothetical protein
MPASFGISFNMYSIHLPDEKGKKKGRTKKNIRIGKYCYPQDVILAFTKQLW